MSNHQYFLEELKIAIQKFVPLTPQDVVDEANSLYEELKADDQLSEQKIRQALSLLGKKEYPYRKAYEELCAGDEEKRLQDAVLDRLEGSVKKKIGEITGSGVILEDYVKSPLFEEDLSGEQRYQVEKAIEMADDVLDNQCDERAQKRAETYTQLVERHRGEVERLQGMIDQLRPLANQYPKQSADILATVNRLEEGWSVVERDPEEEEIKKEIEYWNTVVTEDADV